MRIKGIVEEDFVNYKKVSMYISIGTCDWKCCIEGGFDKSVCQNQQIAKIPDQIVENDTLIKTYLENPISEAIVIGGLEPFTYYDDLYEFIETFRKYSNDDIVIYTGYNKDEIIDNIKELSKFENIILKFGRFQLNNMKHFDNILGVELVSDNQYAEKIS